MRYKNAAFAFYQNKTDKNKLSLFAFVQAFSH